MSPRQVKLISSQKCLSLTDIDREKGRPHRSRFVTKSFFDKSSAFPLRSLGQPGDMALVDLKAGTEVLGAV